MVIAKLTGKASEVWEVHCHIPIKGYWPRYEFSQIDLGEYTIVYSHKFIFIRKLKNPKPRVFESYEDVYKKDLAVGEEKIVRAPGGGLLVTVKRLG